MFDYLSEKGRVTRVINGTAVIELNNGLTFSVSSKQQLTKGDPVVASWIQTGDGPAPFIIEREGFWKRNSSYRIFFFKNPKRFGIKLERMILHQLHDCGIRAHKGTWFEDVGGVDVWILLYDQDTRKWIWCPIDLTNKPQSAIDGPGGKYDRNFKRGVVTLSLSHTDVISYGFRQTFEDKLRHELNVFRACGQNLVTREEMMQREVKGYPMIEQPVFA